MGAIFGTYSKEKDKLEKYNSRAQFFEKYKFDRSDFLEKKCSIYSCFHQEFTLESKNEILPYYDEESNCLITADVILDNRDELIKLLKLKESVEWTDGRLILESYKKWNKDCPMYLLGDYSFAIHDYNTDEIILVKDHVGKRSLYYTYDNNSIAFSTILEPLSIGKDINVDYFKRFLGISYITNDVHPNETIYKDVYHTKPAHILIYKNGKIIEKRYWNFKKYKHKMSINSTVQHFNKLYSEAVRCRLRTNGKVGILLSGGLDSSSVACVAAPILDKENKKLYSYTTIASEEYGLNNAKYTLANEMELVKEMEKKYPNIIINALDSKGRNSYNSNNILIEIMEQPYKFIENGYWLNYLNEKAGEEGCKVLLDGQFGNYGISHTNIMRSLKFKFQRFQWISFSKDFSNFCRIRGYSRKKNAKLFLKTYLQKTKVDPKDYLTKFANVSGENSRLIHDYFYELSHKPKFVSKRNEDIAVFMRDSYLNEFSAYETKMGLKYNIIKRDPTRDIRILEFCYNMPPEMFNYMGESRTLIKIAMKNIVPDPILNNKKLGLQGADWLHRVQPILGDILNQLRKDIDDFDIIDEVIDKSAFLKLLEVYDKFNISEMTLDERVDLRSIFIVINFIEFLKKENQKY